MTSDNVLEWSASQLIANATTAAATAIRADASKPSTKLISGLNDFNKMPSNKAAIFSEDVLPRFGVVTAHEAELAKVRPRGGHTVASSFDRQCRAYMSTARLINSSKSV
jgi:hypothetical protein